MGITLLLVMSVSTTHTQKFPQAIIFFVAAALLAYMFFWYRKILLTIIALTFLMVNAGLNNLAHPSVAGYLTTYGSATGLVLVVWWRSRKRAQLGRKLSGPEGMHKLFDKDSGDEL
jgi:hypothetical protein